MGVCVRPHAAWGSTCDPILTGSVSDPSRAWGSMATPCDKGVDERPHADMGSACDPRQHGGRLSTPSRCHPWALLYKPLHPFHFAPLHVAFAMETRSMNYIILCLYAVLILNLQRSALALSSPQVPCFFIFGDSLVDNGNNNQLETKAKANYFPYGIDFPQGPTGRFTNGPNAVDILAKLLGFDTYIPPFATARGEDIIKGVNYGSGAAGIRNETGQHWGDRISLDRQLQNHNLTISQIAQLLHGNDITLAKNDFSKCLYYFQIGSNDYINNYYVPHYYSSSSLYTPEKYATVLIQQYSQQLKTLYSYGARKIAVSGLGPLGCIPAESGTGIGSGCAESINDAVQLFNDKLKLLVDELNWDLTNAKFMYTNAMTVVPADLISLGNIPCCKVSNSTTLCISGQAPCLIRASHAFYDNFHPTETVNNIVATAIYLDIQKLIQ